jgi:hypothetical protein
MVQLEPTGSRGDHEAAIEQFLTESDPQLGPILAAYLKFDRLDGLTDTERRRLRGEIATAVRNVLDEDAPQ